MCSFEEKLIEYQPESENVLVLEQAQTTDLNLVTNKELVAELLRRVDAAESARAELRDEVNKLIEERDDAERQVQDYENNSINPNDVSNAVDSLAGVRRDAEALASMIDGIHDQLDGLRYVDLEDVLDTVDGIKSDAYDAKQSAELLSGSAYDVEVDLERLI